MNALKLLVAATAAAAAGVAAYKKSVARKRLRVVRTRPALLPNQPSEAPIVTCHGGGAPFRSMQ